MNRPLLLAERVEIETEHLEDVDPQMSNLVACAMFLAGQLIGGYPTARSHILLRKEEDTGLLVMQLTLTVPLEEIRR